MSKILVITYAFPPSSAIGALRPWGLYRHLSSYGWDPVILTASAGESLADVIRIPHRPAPERLRELLGLPKDAPGLIARSVRAFRLAAGQFAMNAEIERGWQAPAVAAAIERLARENCQAILSTSPPATTHLIARKLKARTGIPWIADLRDLWADNYTYGWSELRRSIDRKIQSRVLGDADALVTVSEPLAQTLRSHSSQPVWSVPNGFPPEESARSDQPLSAKFSVTYTGTLYAGKRDPTPLFQALKGLIASEQVDSRLIEVRFCGRNVDQTWLNGLIAGHGLSSQVTIGGLLPRRDALERQRESQLLLALDWMDVTQKGVYTGKIFEYLAARRPILSIGPRGSVVDTLLQETGAGLQCETPNQVAEFLIKSYNEFAQTGRVAFLGNPDAIREYDHASMARRFATLLTPLVEQSRPA